MHELGVGPQPIPQKKLTVEGLAAAIHQAVEDADMRRRAETVGEQIRAEDGTGNAVKIIDHVICKKRHLFNRYSMYERLHRSWDT